MSIALAAALTAWAAVLASKDCPPLTVDQPKHLERHIGRFSDSYYGYSVEVPAGRVAYSDPPPLPSHGFRVWLSRRRPISSIYVLAFDKAIDSPMEDIERDFVELETGDDSDVSITSVGDERLAPWPKPLKRYSIAYSCACTDPWVEIAYFVSHGSGRIYYRIGVITHRSRLKNDEIVLRRMLATWREILPTRESP